MATLCLISSNQTRDPYPVYPLGLSMIAEAARAKGHTAAEWDFLADGDDAERLGEWLLEKKPDVVGISLRNVDSVNYHHPVSYVESCESAVRAIRKCTSVPIVLGGSAYSIFPERILQESGADYGIVGEGESEFVRLIDALENGRPPEEKVIRSAGKLPGEAIACPVRESRLADFYLHEGGMLNIQTKRGCPFECVYCTYPQLEGRKYRFRRPEDVADEIQMLAGRHNADYFAITDSVFNDTEGHFLSVAEAMIRREIRIPWMCFLRPQHFTAQEVDVLKRAGLHAVEWGTDAASDRTLEQMGKSFTWEAVAESNALFAAAGIANSHFIIFGGPGENEETLQSGLDNVAKLDRCVIFASIGVRVFPATPIYNRLTAENPLFPGRDLLEPFFHFSPDVRPDRLHDRLLASFADRRDRIYPGGGESERTGAFHRMGYRGPLWDLILRERPAGRRR